MLRVSVLGPLAVRRDGQLLAVPAGKVSELLVRLALAAGDVVGTDRLIDDLWAAGNVSIRRNTLQAQVTRLRRALGDRSLVASRGSGYMLDVEPAAVDAHAALSQMTTASRFLDAGDNRAALHLCESTLALYHDELLPAAGDAVWVAPYRVRLEQLRTRLIEMLFSARLQGGDVGNVIGEMEAAVAAYPFRERMWELLITALYRAGRQADALATYARVRSRLSDELGLEPGPQLQRLEQRILNHDPSLSLSDGVTASPGPETPDGNLPSLTLELIGRRREANAVSDLLAARRLVEIVGPGGVGKTALAIAACRISPASGAFGSAWLVRLETAAMADDVVDAVIAALNIPGPEEALFERLRRMSAVLILDNCEHVVDYAAALAMRLLDVAPGLRILCTSQVPLGIDGEAVFELEPLALSDAVELFNRRATKQRSTQYSSDTDDTVLELCRSLDGLPLAIELAAARTKTLSVDEITRRLDHRFSLLHDPTSRKPERRRSLRLTIRWSYELLFPDDQRGLWAIATFPAGAPMPAVEFVLPELDVPASAAIDVVARLVNRSLVIVDENAASAPASDGHAQLRPSHAIRYRLLDSIRAFALESMDDAGRSDRAHAAHAAWFAAAAHRSTDGVRSRWQAEHLSFASVERANIDAALVWSAANNPPLALSIANGFGWAWIVLGDSRGAQRILAALEAAGPSAEVHEHAQALLLTAWIEASTGHLNLARQQIADATELADTINDVDLQARCAYYLAYVVSHHGEFRAAMELTDRSRALYDRMDRPWDQAATWLFTARAAISAGDRERSVHAVERVQHWLRTVDDPWLQVRGDAVAGELARLQQRFDDAVVHLRRASETSGRLGFAQTEAYQLSSLGRAQCQAGDYPSGLSTLELAVEKAQTTGDARLAALARIHLGRCLRALGDLTRARRALESATAWNSTAGGGEQAALGECLLAALDARDAVPGAHQRLDAILTVARMRGDAPVEVFALDALALVAVEEADIASAKDLLDAADRRMPAAAHFITNLDRSDARAVRRVI